MDRDFHDNYEYEYHQYLQDIETPALDHKLKVFHGNHGHQLENDIRIHQKILKALYAMRFYDESVFVQYWAAIDFKYGFVLTTCGQPFGHSMDSTNKFEQYHVVCLDHNSYVGRNKRECIGPPARVFFNKSPEWTQDVSKYNEMQYPQLQDAKLSNIQGSLFMPVLEGDQCIGVLEIAMTKPKNNFEIEIRQICNALKGKGLKSSVQNENIFDTLNDYSPLLESRDITKKSRNSKSKMIARNDITRLFGLCKADAIKICHISKNTFKEAYRKYGIWEWPCTRSGIVKSSAYMALTEHAKTFLSSDLAWRIKCIKSPSSLSDGKRVRDQLDESASTVLLELDRHKNKRSQSEKVSQCQLLWSFSTTSGEMPIANCLAFSTSNRSFNGILIYEHCVMVHVDEVYPQFMGIPVPKETFIKGEIELMNQAVMKYIQWPRNSIKVLDALGDLSPSVEPYIPKMQDASEDHVHLGSNEFLNDDVFLAENDAFIGTRMDTFVEPETQHDEQQMVYATEWSQNENLWCSANRT